MSEADELERVRGELRRLGYLSHRFERFLLQDALRSRPPLSVLAGLTLKVALVGGSLLAAANAVGLAIANDAIPAAPLDLLALFAHLLAPAALATALGFLALAALYALAMRLLPPRRIERWTAGASTGLAVALAAGTLVAARGAFADWPFAVRVAAVVALPLLGAALVKLFADGLLSFGIRLTLSAPRARLISRTAVVAALAASVVALAALGLLAPPPTAPAPPVALATAPGEAVLVVGIDGVLPSELDYLLARGDLPGLSTLLARGGAVARLARTDERTPAALWTTVATGVAPHRHGVVALDSFRPRGAATPLARTGAWRLWFERVEQPLGWVEYRPLLANRRRAWTFWELAARGGAASVAIDWWATFPAESTPTGLTVAHGAYSLLAERAEGAVAPEDRRAEIAALAAEPSTAGAGDPLLASLPPAEARRIVERALAPDGFYRAVAERALGAAPRAVALYLPAIDIAADGWRGGEVPFADLVRRELAATDALIAKLAPRFGRVIVVLDPARRGGDEGRALILGPGCSSAGRLADSAIAPAQIAAAALRTLGLPQSRELPDPPAICAWPAPPARVDGYGDRSDRAPGAKSSDEYLESLRSLGYL
ncbi:MAG: alkaline phosphatase family protein [Thermoanaerobaculia bacterium]